MSRSGFALVGPGRLGIRFARALVEAGLPCRAIRGHTRAPTHLQNIVPRCKLFDSHQDPHPWPPLDLVLIAVRDREIVDAAQLLETQGLEAGTIVLHTSGLHTAALLTPCRQTGASIGSWHPLQTFPAGNGPVELQGVWCAIEGDDEAMRVAEDLSLELGMRPWRIAPEAKPRYHAAASVAANLTHVLLAAAGKVLGTTGIPSEPPARALETMVSSSFQTAFGTSGLEGLTGPMARGDRETVSQHLAVLPPELATIYRAVDDLASKWPRIDWHGSIDPCDGDV